MTKATRPLKLKPDADQTKEGAKNLARLVLAADTVRDKEKARVLDSVIWLLTEADYPKHQLPLRTEKAHVEIEKGGKLGPRLRHEHVFTRKWLVKQLLDRPQDTDSLLDMAIACVVLKEEGTRLDAQKDKQGWRRYKAALDAGEISPVIEVKPDGTIQPFKFPR